MFLLNVQICKLLFSYLVEMCACTMVSITYGDLIFAIIHECRVPHYYKLHVQTIAAIICRCWLHLSINSRMKTCHFLLFTNADIFSTCSQVQTNRLVVHQYFAGIYFHYIQHWNKEWIKSTNTEPSVSQPRPGPSTAQTLAHPTWDMVSAKV